MVKHHQCQIFRQNTIVFPKIVKRFKRDINAVSNGIQLDIDGQNESENFSLYLKKNANLGYFYCISSQLKPTTKHHVCFVHLIFGFWSYYVNFVYILQSKMGKTEKNGKKIMQQNWPKYQKPKDENLGWSQGTLLKGIDNCFNAAGSMVQRNLKSEMN